MHCCAPGQRVHSTKEGAFIDLQLACPCLRDKGMEERWESKGMEEQWESRGMEEQWESRGMEEQWQSRGIEEQWESKGSLLTVR